MSYLGVHYEHGGDRDGGDRYVLDDYTDWSIYHSRLCRNSKVWCDHVCWSLINIILLVVLWFIDLLGHLGGKQAKKVSQALHARYKHPCAPVGPAGANTHPLSAVNAETPDIHHTYLAGTDKTAGTDLTKREFDLDNALFFIHLCALVYEDECVLRYVLRQWHLEYRVILSPDEECISQAWVIYHSNATCTEGDSCPRRSVGQDFIAVVFKGTSSFNFTEWMIDFTMSKIKPHGENLPGMIHEGFYEQFQWPIYLRAITDEDGEVDETEKGHQADDIPDPLHATKGFVCSEEEANRRLGKDVVSDDDMTFTPGLTFYELIIRQVNWVIQRAFLFNQQAEDAGPGPAIWVAGHSLGAAQASLFFAHLLHVPNCPLTISKRALKGGYTFGTPRTGDARYAKEIGRHPAAKYLYNIVNANDIVCTVPLGGNSEMQDPRALTNFWHIGTPILLNYWGSLERGKRWGWSNFAINALLHYLRLPVHFWRSKAKLLTLVRLPFLGLLFFFIADHLPSEYLNHLHACKKEQHNQQLNTNSCG